MMKRHAAYFTHEYDESGGHLYYFAPKIEPELRCARQVHVQAILDLAVDGTLIGIELAEDDVPPPPKGIWP